MVLVQLYQRTAWKPSDSFGPPRFKRERVPMTVRGGGVPIAPLACMPGKRMGPPPRSFAADAHHHRLGTVIRPAPRIQGRGAIDPRRKAGSPLIVIPTALSVPSCSKLSRYGLARAEYAARLGRGRPLTAPARVGFAILRVGAKKRNSRSNKETDQDNMPRSETA